MERRMLVEDALRQANTTLNLLYRITRYDMLKKIHTLGLLTDLLNQKYTHDPVLQEYLEKLDQQIPDLTEMVMFTSDYQDLGVRVPVWQQLYQVPAGVQELARTVSIEVDPSLGTYEIYADPLLSRVFYNLVDNAIRHGGRVNRICVRGGVQIEGLVIVWEDDGVGVPKTEKEKIFKKGHGKNTGLGLFLVREILSITCIRIPETGTPGAGARFEIVVPKDSYRLFGP